MAQEVSSVDELDNHHHQKLRRREWIAERCGMLLICLVIAAALLGLLGAGPLSSQTAVSSDGRVSVEYDGIVRNEAPAVLTVRFRKPQSSDDLMRLGLSRDFTDRVSIESMTPFPQSAEMESDRIMYNFRTPQLTGDGSIVIRYKSDGYGPVHYSLDLSDSRAAVSQFVLP